MSEYMNEWTTTNNVNALTSTVTLGAPSGAVKYAANALLASNK